jgi:hypothetical protein
MNGQTDAVREYDPDKDLTANGLLSQRYIRESLLAFVYEALQLPHPFPGSEISVAEDVNTLLREKINYVLFVFV